MLSKWRDQIRRRSSRRLGAQIAPAMHAAAYSRWRDFLIATPAQLQRFIRVKWRLPDDWYPFNDPPRPRTAAEVGEILGIDDGMVHALDWILVDHGRSYWREVDSRIHRFVSAPIDVAQRWWDESCGGTTHDDGRPKSYEEILSAPRHKVRRPKPTPHTIDDPAEKLRHLIEDHGLTSLRHYDPGYGFEYDHESAHEYEAQDQEWDRTLRASEL